MWVSLAIVTSILLLLGGFLFLHRHKSPFSPGLSKEAGFTVYYPSGLPHGWRIRAGSAHIDRGIVFFTVDSPKGTIVVSEQAVPASFDFAAFYQNGLQSTNQFSTPLGQAAVGKRADNQAVGSLVTDSTWILASPDSSSIDSSFIMTLFRSFTL